MSKLDKVLKSAAGNAAGDAPNVEDVFSTYVYRGTSSTHTITNGIDLDGEGGMVWIKGRDQAVGTLVWDTTMSPYYNLSTYNTDGITNQTSPYGIASGNSTGFSIGNTSWSRVNSSGNTYASWTFRKAPRFFDVVTWTGNGVAGREIAHGLGCEVGMIITKRTDDNSSYPHWYVYHRYDSTKSGFLNDTSAFISVDYMNGVTNSKFETDLNISSQEYVAYLFAHDPDGADDDGMIACGSYTGNSSATGPVIDLGWEPQYVLIKWASGANAWMLHDSMRGITDSAINRLEPNTSGVEVTAAAAHIKLTSTGFQILTSGDYYNGSGTYIYMAIRAPMMKEPEAGTEVFAGDYRTSGFTAGFPVDMAFMRDLYTSADWRLGSRLQGAKKLATNSTALEASDSNFVFDSMTDFYSASPPTNYQSWMFKRAKGFFDVVAYTGTGVAHTEAHNLGVVPEMMWVKDRDVTSYWSVYIPISTGSTTGTLWLSLDTQAYDYTFYWNDTTPTDSLFTVGDTNNTNRSTSNFIAYLFATLAGVSKVGSYTGTGTSSPQDIACGFSAGARFVLIKRTDSSGDWYIWDTVRGINPGNENHLSLNTPAGEVSDDSIDQQSAGFTVNQVAATNINVTSATYIFLAIA